MAMRLKERVREYWERDPCGSREDALPPIGTREFFDQVERERYGREHFLPQVAGFNRWPGKKVLEVGCGMGTDLLQFARGGAEANAIDLTQKGVELTRSRLEMYGFHGDVKVGDAEDLPFPSDTFDLVYSWGVIHLTDDPAKAAAEIVRVCKPGGSILVMVYNRYSLFSLQAWILYGLLQGKPRRPLDEIIAHHVESPGTRVYTPRQALGLFPRMDNARARTIVTAYDVRLGRRHFLPRWVEGVVPSRAGWFLVVEGTKALPHPGPI
jgi:SAM-dependent methyltransferase